MNIYEPVLFNQMGLVSAIEEIAKREREGKKMAWLVSFGLSVVATLAVGTSLWWLMQIYPNTAGTSLWWFIQMQHATANP